MILSFLLELSTMSSHQQLLKILACIVCFPPEAAYVSVLCLAVVWWRDTSRAHNKAYLGKSCWGKEVFRFEFSSIVFAFVIIVQWAMSSFLVKSLRDVITDTRGNKITLRSRFAACPFWDKPSTGKHTQAVHIQVLCSIFLLPGWLLQDAVVLPVPHIDSSRCRV